VSQAGALRTEAAMTSFERAIELAKSGKYDCVDEIKRANVSEGYETDKTRQ
jgi:hypothetical protein